MGVVDKNDLAPDLSGEELEQCYEKLRLKYEDRLKRILKGIKDELESFSWFCSKTYVLEDGVYAIAVSRDKTHLGRDGEPDDLDVEILARILKSKEWDGTRGGIAFNVELVSYGGEMVGGLTPFNYTDRVWVPAIDDNGVEERLVLLEDVEPYGVVTLLQKWIKGRSAR